MFRQKMKMGLYGMAIGTMLVMQMGFATQSFAAPEGSERKAVNQGYGRWEEAIKDYTKAIEINPQSPEFYNKRGALYHRLERYEEAIADYTAAIKINPQMSLYYCNRASVYSSLDKNEEALKDYARAIEVDPKNADRYSERGDFYRRNNRYAEAIADYTEAIKLSPQKWVHYSGRALVYRFWNKPEEAIKDYTKAIEMNPKNEMLYSYRGVVYYEEKRYEEAIADYTVVIRLDPKAAGTCFNRANVYYRLHKYEEAIKDYTKAIGVNPKNSDFYNRRGDAYYQEKRYKEAIADYTAALAVNPKCTEAYWGQGRAFRELGQDQAAGVAFKQYLQSKNVDPVLANNAAVQLLEIEYEKSPGKMSLEELARIAWEEWRIGNYDKAVLYYTKVIERNPNVQNVYAMRGLSYVFLKKHDLALADYLKAVEKKPTDGGLFLAIGNIYSEKQNYNAAIEAYTKSIVLKDTYFARMARGKTYVETQRYDLAKHDFACMEVLWPKQEGTVICKAGLYGLLGEYHVCMEILQQGLSQFPNQPVLLFHMGQCYEKLGQQDLALQYYEKAMAKESSKSTEKLTVQAKKKLKLRLAGNWKQETAWVFGF